MPDDPQIPGSLTIDQGEVFPHLNHAPIVEAVIQINARVQAPWEEAIITGPLATALPDYPSVQGMNAMQMTIAVQDGAGAAAAGQAVEGLPVGHEVLSGIPVARNLHTGFVGLRMASADGKWIAVFGRESFALSRLAPYEDWRGLCAEALRLWAIHARLGNIQDVSRLASRFINRVEVPLSGLKVEDYFEGFGGTPAGFPLGGFLQQTLLLVPGHPYQVNIVRTHLPVTEQATHLPLIFDLEAVCTEQTSIQAANIPARLADLRWVKNKVFFSSMTPRLLALCQ